MAEVRSPNRSTKVGQLGRRFQATLDGGESWPPAGVYRPQEVTGTGARLGTPEAPFPSWPWRLAPQHMASPPLPSAQVWRPPAVMLQIPLARPGTWTGTWLDVVEPFPNCPDFGGGLNLIHFSAVPGSTLTFTYPCGCRSGNSAIPPRLQGVTPASVAHTAALPRPACWGSWISLAAAGGSLPDRRPRPGGVVAPAANPADDERARVRPARDDHLRARGQPGDLDGHRAVGDGAVPQLPGAIGSPAPRAPVDDRAGVIEPCGDHPDSVGEARHQWNWRRRTRRPWAPAHRTGRRGCRRAHPSRQAGPCRQQRRRSPRTRTAGHPALPAKRPRHQRRPAQLTLCRPAALPRGRACTSVPERWGWAAVRVSRRTAPIPTRRAHGRPALNENDPGRPGAPALRGPIRGTELPGLRDGPRDCA